MSGLLVLGPAGPLADAFADATRIDLDAEPPAAARAVLLVLPPAGGPLGRTDEAAFAALVDAAVAAPARALRRLAAAGAERIAIVCPACAVLPDHRDGARSTAAAGTGMLADIASTLTGIAVNVLAVADEVPPAEVAAMAEAVLAQPSLNGATIRLDGGRDAVLDVQTRADGA